jgi:eukaryotic-like serine/threonine-protein kinase
MAIVAKKSEPIPGYTLRERLGSGGYGEVWKADAPGGLFKAVKLVYGQMDGERAIHELKALNRIKTLRHPFLLSLERFEVVEGQLVIVTELAECSLKDRFLKMQQAGNIGIARKELLQYMRDAADALDYMNEQHSLQHLDIKPENLLLVGDHVKVADFGLVKDIQDQAMSMLGGLTPLYAAPEVFNGTPSRRSDQYSLAIVYQEMLTGAVPFPGKSTAQLATQHLNASPDVYALAAGERKVIARALAKDPAKRFESCREMVEYLQNEILQNSLPSPESWFTPQDRLVISGDRSGSVSSTKCFGDSDTENDSQNGEAESQPLAADTPIVRGSYDIFADIEEAEQACAAEATRTFSMSDTRDVSLTYRSAPTDDCKQAMRPTLVIGLGKLGGLVTQKLKQILSERLGDLVTCPALAFLVIDTQAADIQAAQRGDHGVPLMSHECLHTPLRKSQDYRGESPSTFNWLSRRWLFNIPRSLQTEGLRPLGRLAMVDHARLIHSSIKKALVRIALTESRETTAKQLACDVSGTPRVLVVGAACGGTSSGMLLDIGFIARQLLDRLGCANTDTLGFMLHFQGRSPATHDLASVNSFTLLSELSHYANGETAFPGDPACGLEPQPAQHAPFTHSYFLKLGDKLQEQQIIKSAADVAELMYMNIAAASAPVFDACRQDNTAEKSQNTTQTNYTLRNSGIHRLGVLTSDMVPWGAMNLCQAVLGRWLNENSESPGTAEEEMQTLINEQSITLVQLCQNILNEATDLLGNQLEKLSLDILQPHLEAVPVPQIDFDLLRNQLNDRLGQRVEQNLGDASNWPSLLQKLNAFSETCAQQISQTIQDCIHASLNQPGARVSQVHRAMALLMNCIGDMHEKARTQRKTLEGQLDIAEQIFKLPVNQRGTVRKTPEEFGQLFVNYTNDRVTNVVIHFVQATIRRIHSSTVKLNEQLHDLRRDVKGLINQFQTQDPKSPENDRTAMEIQKLLRELLTLRCNELTAQLDTQLQSQFFDKNAGYFNAMLRGGDQRIAFLTQFFNSSKELVLELFKEVKVLPFILPHWQEGNTSAHWQTCVGLAKPKLLTHGECQVILATAETELTEPFAHLMQNLVKEEFGVQPAIIKRGENDFVVVNEIGNCSLAQTAQQLIDYRSDLMEFATRVFTRNDIPFEPISIHAAASEETSVK